MALITFNTDPPLSSRLIRVVVTGHMVDREERSSPRFPSERVGAVRATLAACLDCLAKPHGALRVVTSGTKGIDLLSISICLDRQWPVEVYLAQDEASFLTRSVNYGIDGPSWLALYERAKQSALVTIHTPMREDKPSQPFCSPPLGTTQHRVDLNEYMVALLRPQDMLVAYWDGQGGDAPGGTEHMVRTALARGVRCMALDAHLIGTVGRPELLRYWQGA